jgi:hypothetical protein
MLQFLTHPVEPIPSSARRTLAEKMASSPEIAGEAWRDSLAEIETHYSTVGDRVMAKRPFSSPRAPQATLRAVAREQVARASERFQGAVAGPTGSGQLPFVPVKGFLDTRLQLMNSIMPPISRLPRNSRGAAAQVA